MADEKKIQLTITNEKMIEKIEKYAAYGFSSRKEFIGAAILAYENTLIVEERNEKLMKKFTEELLKISEKREGVRQHASLTNEYL
ncbi:MAG: hypothetical protein ACLTPC_03105 [Lacrimispora saccharolytica]